MARLPRISPIGVPVHLIQRGNNRQTCFGTVKDHVEGDLREEIRSSANKGMAIGHDRFKDEIEALPDRMQKPKKVERPVGWHKKKDGV